MFVTATVSVCGKRPAEIGSVFTPFPPIEKKFQPENENDNKNEKEQGKGKKLKKGVRSMGASKPSGTKATGWHGRSYTRRKM